jgi:hypothetical protein
MEPVTYFHNHLNNNNYKWDIYTKDSLMHSVVETLNAEEMRSSMGSILQDRSETMHTNQHAADTKILHQPDAQPQKTTITTTIRQVTCSQ